MCRPKYLVESTKTPSPPPSRVYCQVVRVHHPGYDDPGNILFSFPAVDVYREGRQQEDGCGTIGGVDAPLVYTACTIVTGNHLQNGFLSRDKSGRDIAWRPQMADAEVNHVLSAGDYYFHIPSPPPTSVSGPSTTSLDAAEPPDLRPPYAVYPTFREWTPPAQVPESFQASIVEDPAPLPSRCHITAEADATDRAHLVPRGESDWFCKNAMWVYHPTSSSYGKDAIDHHGNIISLRRDLHYQFDSSHFTIFPRPDTSGTYQPTVHVLTTNAPSLYKKHHARRLRPLRGISAHFLFSRFAWSIFPLLRGFFQAGKARSALLAGDIKRTITASECEQLVQGQGAGRSGLSPKRKSTSPGKTLSKRPCTEYARDRDSPDSAVAGLRQAEEPCKRRRSSSCCSAGTETGSEISDVDELRFYAANCLRPPKKLRTMRDLDNARFWAAQGPDDTSDNDEWEELSRGRARYCV